MAGTSLLALIDDIATLLDDISVLTKSAASKTAGVLGDDLALNAEQLSGLQPDRELAVVWAVTKGSFLNKLILVPSALLLSALVPWLVGPAMMAGGGYLCFEGFEKILHSFQAASKTSTERRDALKHLAEGADELVNYEKEKIKGAILTDFILSGEIVVIALGSVQGEPLLTQALVVSLLAVILTVGVYALVATIVKLDDFGLFLLRNGTGRNPRALLGSTILWFAPRLLKLLSVLGTVAMFLVGGGIWVHGIGPLSKWVHGAEHLAHTLPHFSSIASSLIGVSIHAALGLVLGAIAVGFVQLGKTFFHRRHA